MIKRNFIIIAVVILLGTAGYFLPQSRFENNNKIYIHVTGAVKKPGIISISCGDTIKNAVDSAGGVLIEADLSGIDLSAKLTYARPLDIPFQ